MKQMNPFDIAKVIVSANLTKILPRDSSGHAKTVLVPGSDGKQYEVILRRGDGYISAECRLMTGKGEFVCKGSKITLCKHGLAAILTAAKDSGISIGIAKNEKNADLLLRLGGRKVVAWSLNIPDRKFYLIAKTATCRK